jgi:hypothetical protein
MRLGGRRIRGRRSEGWLGEDLSSYCFGNSPDLVDITA